MTNSEQCLRDALAEIMEVEAQQISITMTFADQGVDSLVALRFTRSLEDLTGTEVQLEWLFDYPSIRELAPFLVEKAGGEWCRAV